MSDTSIEWTDKTWNPTRGCTRVSEGCTHCYAETFAARNLPEMRSPTTGKPFAVRTPAGPRWTGAVELIPSKLDEPLRWRKPQRVFVNSMSDLFHESLIWSDIAAVFAIMACSPHTFQILTKRPARMLEFCRLMADRNARTIMTNAVAAQRVDLPHALQVPLVWPLPNVWLGVSVEDPETAALRIQLLLQTPAAVRFISLEPQLAHVDLSQFMGMWTCKLTHDHRGAATCPGGLDWVIVGGESGPGARPFDLAWARSAVTQCKAAGVPVFVKQLGRLPFHGYLSDKEVLEGERGRPRPEDQPLTDEQAAAIMASEGLVCPIHRLILLKDRKGGSMDEWPEDLRVREFPA